MNRKFAILLLIVTGIVWSYGGLFIKLIPWFPISIARIRSGLSALVIYLYRRLDPIYLGKYVWAGAISYSVMVICFVFANKITTSGNVILIQYAAPIYVALFSFSFLGEKANIADWVSILIIFVGLSSFFYEDLSYFQLWGNILSILSGIGFAGLTLCMRKEKKANPVDCVLVGNILTFLVCIPFYKNGVTFDIQSWVSIIFLGVIQLGFSYIFFSIAIKYVKALDAIIYPVIEPLVNPILTFLFLGELMSNTAVFGGALVIIGVVGRGLYQNLYSNH